MLRLTRRLACLAVGCGTLTAIPAAAATPVAPAGLTVATFATAPSGIAGPDDIAPLGKGVVVGWQNGIGPKGEPSPTGATQSDVVLYSKAGTVMDDWKVTGHLDGIGTKGATIYATVNEDGNTSLYTIAAHRSGAQPVQYTFSPEPDSGHSGGVLTGGGTDGVQVLHDGRLLISASAPNNGSEETVPNATATFLATLNRHTLVAALAPTFENDAQATDALTGETVTLGAPGSSPHALTDPDSNAIVPAKSPLYAGDYMLNSEGDGVLVFAPITKTGLGALTELPLSREGSPAQTGDVAWATAKKGILYVVDKKANTIYSVTGKFPDGQAYTGLAQVGSTENNTEVDVLNLTTGEVSPFITGFGGVKGLLFA
ncbi:MAG TPA: hypothetical protein VGN13_11520 [Solirubrobacteraceae bacterium]